MHIHCVCACCMPACMHVCVCVCVLCPCFSFFLAPPPHLLHLYLVCLYMHAYIHVCVHSLAPPPLWLQGITIPSERRYVCYFGHLLQRRLEYSIKTLILKGLQFEGIPNYNLTSVQGCGEWAWWGMWSGRGLNVVVSVHNHGSVYIRTWRYVVAAWVVRSKAAAGHVITSSRHVRIVGTVSRVVVVV